LLLLFSAALRVTPVLLRVKMNPLYARYWPTAGSGKPPGRGHPPGSDRL